MFAAASAYFFPTPFMIRSSTPCLETVSVVRGADDWAATINIERPAPRWFPFRPRSLRIVEIGHIDAAGEFQPFMGICADHLRPLIDILNQAALKMEYDTED